MSKNETYQAARGTRDILPKDQPYFQMIKHTSECVLQSLGVERIDLPTFENAEVYTRGVGKNTDIVSKGMYLVSKHSDDIKDPTFALRPEGTAGTVRAYIENGMGSWPQPVKLYYVGPMYRHDRPQRGRYREFYQVGVEIFGDRSSKSDYLSIMSAWKILSDLGLKNLIVFANSIGCPNCRPKYTKKLKSYFKKSLNKLCSDCKIRYEENPLRLLDCKEEGCKKIAKGSPLIIDNICGECKDHFQSTLELLDYFEIRYDLDPYLVRGLDYYSRTVFEIAAKSDKERQNSLGGGGRYDGLVETLGGVKTPAVGYSLGIDRIVDLMREQKIKPTEIRGVEVCILQLGEKAKEVAKKVYDMLSKNDTNVHFIPSNDGLRPQMRQAVKTGAKYALIIGQKEAVKEEVILRNLKASSQETFFVKDIIEEIHNRIEKDKC